MLIAIAFFLSIFCGMFATVIPKGFIILIGICCAILVYKQWEEEDRKEQDEREMLGLQSKKKDQK